MEVRGQPGESVLFYHIVPRIELRLELSGLTARALIQAAVSPGPMFFVLWFYFFKLDAHWDLGFLYWVRLVGK